MDNVERWFKVVGGQPIPIAAPIEGVKCYTLQDAANQFGASRHALEELYDSFVVAGGCLPPGADPDELEELTGDDLEEASRERDWAAAVESAVAGWMTEPYKVILRRSEFSHLTDIQFGTFLAMCFSRGVDPWRGEAYAVIEIDRFKARPAIRLRLTLQKITSIAHDSGKYAGIDEPRFETYEGMPVSATITVYRMVEGVRCPYSATARVEDQAEDASDYRQRSPFNALAIRAERAAIRKAFAVEISAAENGPAVQHSPRGPGRPSPTGPSPARPAGPGGFERRPPRPMPVATPPPTHPGPAGASTTQAVRQSIKIAFTAKEFQEGLRQLGLDQKAIENVVDSWDKRLPGQLDRSPGNFYGFVIGQVRQNPERWGGRAAG